MLHYPCQAVRSDLALALDEHTPQGVLCAPILIQITQEDKSRLPIMAAIRSSGASHSAIGLTTHRTSATI